MANRRDFLKQSALASAAVLTSSNAFAFRGAPNEKVIMGIMGTNSRGAFLAKTFANLPNVEVGFICDPDEKVLAKTIAEIEKQTGKKPKGFADIRKMLEQKDLDGLAIAAPDHWHTPAAIMGLQAGKNV